jgi:hypothetical protein
MVLAGPLDLKDKSPRPALSMWPIGAIQGGDEIACSLRPVRFLQGMQECLF